MCDSLELVGFVARLVSVPSVCMLMCVRVVHFVCLRVVMCSVKPTLAAMAVRTPKLIYITDCLMRRNIVKTNEFRSARPHLNSPVNCG